MASPRARAIAGIAGRLVVGLVVAVLLAGAALVILAYYGDVSFDVEGVAIAIVAAGILVYLWTRWR